jgi:hypothetical protein
VPRKRHRATRIDRLPEIETPLTRRASLVADDHGARRVEGFPAGIRRRAITNVVSTRWLLGRATDLSSFVAFLSERARHCGRAGCAWASDKFPDSNNNFRKTRNPQKRHHEVASAPTANNILTPWAEIGGVG